MKQGIFADASSAVAAAREAQARYAKLRLGERDRILAALRQALAAEAETLAGMTVTETGMLIKLLNKALVEGGAPDNIITMNKLQEMQASLQEAMQGAGIS